MKTIRLLNNIDELLDENTDEFVIKDDLVTLKNNDKIYLFSYLLASKIIKLKKNAIVANILKNTDMKLKEKQEINRVFKPSEYSKIVLSHLLYQYFMENNEINIEGFLAFRAKFFLKIIQKEIENLIRKKNVEKEYNAFIGLLKYYLAIQKPRILEAYIEILPNSEFAIFDAKKRNVTQKWTAEFIGEMEILEDEEIKNDDLLISILIYLSPQKIVFINWHALKNLEIKKTIQDVFEKRIFFKTCQK